MLTSLKGTYENGQITLEETPPTTKPVQVVVTFLEELDPAPPRKKRQAGTMKGQIWMSDDFDEPLDDLKDYM